MARDRSNSQAARSAWPKGAGPMVASNWSSDQPRKASAASRAVPRMTGGRVAWGCKSDTPSGIHDLPWGPGMLSLRG